MIQRINVVKKNQYLLSSGAFFSAYGNSLTSIYLFWYLVHKTHVISSVSFILIISLCQVSLLNLISGSFIDNLDRRHITITCDISQFFLTLIIALIVYKEISILFIYIAYVLNSTVLAIFRPAIISLTAEVIDSLSLERSNALIAFSYRSGSILGAISIPFILKFLPGYSLLIIDACSYLVSANCCLLLTRIHKQKCQNRNQKTFINYLKDNLSSLRYLKDKKFILIVGFISTIPFTFETVFNLFETEIILNHLNLGSTGLSYTDAAYSTGAIIGALILSYSWKISSAIIRIFSFGVCLGVSVIFFGLVNHLLQAMICSLFIGISLVAIAIISMTWLQINTDKNYLGRVQCVASLISTPIMIFILIASGYLFDAALYRIVLIVIGFIIILASFLLFCYRKNIYSKHSLNSELVNLDHDKIT